MPDAIDQQINKLRALFQADEEARKAEQEAKYQKKRDAHLRRRRQSLLDRKWKPPCQCRSCWRSALLMQPELCCRRAKGKELRTGDTVLERWWEC